MNGSVETSLWNGFSRLSYQQRATRVAELTGLDQASIEALSGCPVTADVGLAESCVENAIGYFAAPLGVVAYMLIDGRDVVVPMAVEETSIIAAASSAAKFFYPYGGVTTRTEGTLSIGQIQMPGAKNSRHVVEAIAANQDLLLACANELVPGLIARGGGARRIEGRVLPRMVVVHVYVETCDAMGANLINQICEGLKPIIEDVTGIHATARACLKMLGEPTAAELGRICAAVGLIQNFAALRAIYSRHRQGPYEPACAEPGDPRRGESGGAPCVSREAARGTTA
jgi:hydroxymethylglutaryl-CoA reductase